MATWSEFEAAAPALAAMGRRLLYRDGPFAGAFLGTVRKDGGPRLHPIFPVLADGQLWALIVNMSYKYRDLQRDPRYALHTFAGTDGGDEFYIMGTANEVVDPKARARIRPVLEAAGGYLHDFEALFALDIERALHTTWENWGTAETWPRYDKWPATGGRGLVV